MTSGRSLGYVTDIEINLEKARIDALIIPGGQQQGFLGMFSKAEDMEIKWKDVKIVGEDVILVNVPAYPKEELEDSMPDEE